MLARLVNLAGEDVQYRVASLRYKMANAEMAKVLVNGSPKTGTTWMLRMVASLPGYAGVGNFDGNVVRYHDVQPGNVVHGHDPYTPELAEILQENGIKVILMVRDPRDQLVSRTFHVKRSEKHSWHDRMREMSMDEALLLCIEGRDGLPGMDQMILLGRSWMEQREAALCVKYEELLARPEHHFAQVLSYIGVPPVPDLAETIVARNRFERLSAGRRFWQNGRQPGQENKTSHFRKGIAGDWRNYLKDEHIARFKEIAGQHLIDLGYEQDFNW